VITRIIHQDIFCEQGEEEKATEGYLSTLSMIFQLQRS